MKTATLNAKTDREKRLLNRLRRLSLRIVAETPDKRTQYRQQIERMVLAVVSLTSEALAGTSTQPAWFVRHHLDIVLNVLIGSTKCPIIAGLRGVVLACSRLIDTYPVQKTKG